MIDMLFVFMENIFLVFCWFFEDDIWECIIYFELVIDVTWICI